MGFRALFVITAVLAALGLRALKERENFLGLLVLVITAVLAWRSRRHAPFFGLAVIVYLAPFASVVLSPPASGRMELRRRCAGLVALLLAYCSCFSWIQFRYIPEAAFRVLAPVGFYPVRECDILMYSGAAGNAAVPFRWGSYALWRLHPKIKVSMDGRYEEVYPESTFQLNQDFFNRRGESWTQLLDQRPVDYILLDYKTSRLRIGDLQDYGFRIVWEDKGVSALLSRGAEADRLEAFVKDHLPDETVEPLDARIANDWWPVPS
jgi:hypothetical protein